MNYAALATLFRGGVSKTQREGIDTILAAAKGLPVEHQAYILATAYHETGRTMQPVREAFGQSDGDTINRLERAWKAGDLRWVKTPYWRPDSGGKAWFGRGYVQLTHRENYAKAGKRLGVDLLGNPALAMDPKIAAQILVRGSVEGWFRRHKLSDFLPGDYVKARQVINGQDGTWHDVARYAETFEAALRSAPLQPTTAPVTLFARLVALFQQLWRKR